MLKKRLVCFLTGHKWEFSADIVADSDICYVSCECIKCKKIKSEIVEVTNLVA